MTAAAELPGRCPVTGGLTTRMTAPSFREHCAARRAGRAEDWRYKPGTVPPPHPRCEICGGDPQYWPQELTIIDTSSQGEPMTTKTTTKPAVKPAAKKTSKPAPIPAPTCADDLPHAHALANQLREIESILEQEAVPHDAPVADQVRELVLALHDAIETMADAQCILSAFFGDADHTLVGVATSAVAYAQELERTIKAGGGGSAARQDSDYRDALADLGLRVLREMQVQFVDAQREDAP